MFPRADYIINNDECWPPYGKLWLGELRVIGAYTIPGLGIVNGILNFASTASTAVGGPQLQSSLLRLGFSCDSNHAIKTTFDLYNLYGLMSVIGLIFPLINLLIVLAALFSISSILGGDTRIFGLERLV